MLKILQISNKAPYPPNDGSSIAIYNMALGFIENGVDLKLVTINTKKHFKADDQVPAEFKEKSKYRSVFRNTDTGVFGALANLFSSDSYFVSRFYFHEFEQQLVDELKRKEYDFVLMEGLFMAVYMNAIRANSKAKIILRAHNVEHLIWERHIANEKSSLKRTYLKLQNDRLRKFEYQVCKQVDGIVSITDVDKNVFQQIAPSVPKYTCITGVDFTKYAMSKEGEDPVMFIFSSMDWLPNIEAVDWFVKNSFPLIKKEISDCKLIIAGRNMPDHIRSILDKNIEIMEHVKSSSEFYEKHGLMLVPLLSGSGLRIKIIEGFSFGKAIVSTSIGAEGIQVTDKEHLLLEDTASGFAKAVVHLLKHKAERDRLRMNARKFAEENFDNKKVVKGLLDFFNTLNA